MNKPTIYAVVRYIKAANLMEEHEVHIYTKQTSNKKVMLAYLKEQRERHKDIPNCKIGLMTREKAEEFRKAVLLADHRREEKLIANYNMASDRLLYKKVACESNEKPLAYN